MKSYTKVYLKYFGYSEADFIPCECCGKKAVDIHHLIPRSKDKSKLNQIDNLIALCRVCHHAAETNKDFNEEMKLIHRKRLLSVKTDFETVKYLHK